MSATELTLAGWRHVYSGKVRDLYVETAVADLASADRVLVVASDRVSAFDHMLSPGIPDKGKLLTTLSLWWFNQLDGIPNHLVAASSAPSRALRDDRYPVSSGNVRGPAPEKAAGRLEGSPETLPTGIPEAVAGQAMLVKALDMFPIECVVRGYLAGSGWLEYQEKQSVCGIPLPAGLSNGDRLPEPIYTPAFKASLGEHDENISFERTIELVGTDVASQLRSLSLEAFARASAIAEKRGVILADTKFEFGADRKTGVITLADEVLTSDSSRYWDASAWQSGNRTDSFDKQIVRNWLLAHWDKTGTPPELPPEIVAQTAARYRELIERLTS